MTKHFSFHIPESYEKSNAALDELLADYPECVRRMRIRRRKMAVTTVRNLCYPGTPYEFWERVRRARAYMNRPDVVALFDEINPKDFSGTAGHQARADEARMAFAMCFLFTYVFDRV